MNGSLGMIMSGLTVMPREPFIWEKGSSKEIWNRCFDIFFNDPFSQMNGSLGMTVSPLMIFTHIDEIKGMTIVQSPAGFSNRNFLNARFGIGHDLQKTF